MKCKCKLTFFDSVEHKINKTCYASVAEKTKTAFVQNS